MLKYDAQCWVHAAMLFVQQYNPWRGWILPTPLQKPYPLSEASRNELEYASLQLPTPFK